jgi:hypothetical protein
MGTYFSGAASVHRRHDYQPSTQYRPSPKETSETSHHRRRKEGLETLQSQILATVTEHLRKRPSWMK